MTINRVKLTDVCTQIFAGGDVPKDRYSEIKTDEYPIPIYANAVKDNGLYGYTDKARVEEECVTVAARGTIGFTAIRKEPFLPVVRLITVIPDQEKIKLGYLYYALRNINPESSGTSIPQLTVPDIKKYSFNIVPLEFQERVVTTLEKIENIIALKNQELEMLDNLIKSRFVEMFGDPISDSMNWGQCPLGASISSIRYGTSTPPQFSETGYAFIRATNIKNGKIIPIEMKYIDQGEADKIEKCKMKGGEIIIVRSGVNSGDTCIITDEYIGQYAAYDIIIELNKSMNPVFVNELINTKYMDVVVKPLTRRAAQPHLNSAQVQSLPVIQVPKEMQDQYSDFVQCINKIKTDLQRSIDETQMIFDSLMQEYFE